MTPFNTGRVQIGLLYTPPKPQIHGHAFTLQTALLARASEPRSTLKRAINAITRKCASAQMWWANH